MDFLDDKGRLFGTINIIDALAVLLVLAVAAAGTAFVLGIDDQPTGESTTVTLEVIDVKPYVADAIPDGPVESDGNTTVRNKSVQPASVVVADQNGTLHERPHPQNKTVTLRVALETGASGGEPTFNGKPLEIGRKLALDLGPVTVRGTVTQLPARN